MVVGFYRLAGISASFWWCSLGLRNNVPNPAAQSVADNAPPTRKSKRFKPDRTVDGGCDQACTTKCGDLKPDESGMQRVCCCMHSLFNDHPNGQCSIGRTEIKQGVTVGQTPKEISEGRKTRSKSEGIAATNFVKLKGLPAGDPVLSCLETKLAAEEIEKNSKKIVTATPEDKAAFNDQGWFAWVDALPEKAQLGKPRV